MRDRVLYAYAQILGLTRPWSVIDVELDTSGEEVRVIVEHDRSQPLCCPECGHPSPGYDTRRRKWRHLDTCQYRTILIAEVPRVKCEAHGVKQVRVPWAEPGSSFTALYESLVIDWLKEASIAALARRLNLSWDEVDGIMQPCGCSRPGASQDGTSGGARAAGQFLKRLKKARDRLGAVASHVLSGQARENPAPERRDEVPARSVSL